MCLKLNDYQFKTSRRNYGSIYVNATVITNQKSVIYTQNQRERNPSILQKKIIRPQGRNKEYKQSTKLQTTNRLQQTNHKNN